KHSSPRYILTAKWCSDGSPFTDLRGHLRGTPVLQPLAVSPQGLLVMKEIVMRTLRHAVILTASLIIAAKFHAAPSRVGDMRLDQTGTMTVAATTKTQKPAADTTAPAPTTSNNFRPRLPPSSIVDPTRSSGSTPARRRITRREPDITAPPRRGPTCARPTPTR